MNTDINSPRLWDTGGQAKTKLEYLRRIVADCTAAKIDGWLVDLFTASAIVKIYDALSEANRRKFIALPLEKMSGIAFRLLA